MAEQLTQNELRMTVLLIQDKKLKSHLTPSGTLPQTPKGCEHFWLENPSLGNSDGTINKEWHTI